MAASYPSAIKIFTTKASGDTVRASHVDDLQDEVSAIETALRTGFNHDLLFTDATYDIGKSGATRPRDLFASRNCVIGGTLAVTGATTLSGAVTASSTLGVTGITTLAALLDLSGAAAGQAKFPATQNPSTDVNTLDDYEEGTWTPAFGGTTSETGQVYSTQVGRYLKVGKQVFAVARLTLSTKGTITGNVVIKGLPFPIENVSGLIYPADIGYWAAMTTAVVTLRGMARAATSQIELLLAAAATGTLSSAVSGDLANTTDLVIAITYRTDN